MYEYDYRYSDVHGMKEEFPTRERLKLMRVDL